ncbi:MAG: ATP-binding protein [Candidatus Cloacimonadaceae bacterium]
MDNHDIDLNELMQRESERVEWKQNVASIDDVIKTIVAFSNDYSNLGGGYVVCGAKECKDAQGFPAVCLEGLTANRLKEIEEKTLSDLRQKVDPEIVPTTRILPAEDESKRVLVFVVPSTGYAHCYRSDSHDSSRYYIRVGSNTIEARNGLMRELMVRKRQLEPWDKRACPNATDSAIDVFLLRDYLYKMRLATRETDIRSFISDQIKISDFVPPLCVKPSLVSQMQVRNFAILMFCANPLEFIDGVYTELSIYRGIDRSEPSAERHQITGTIVNQANRIIELLNAEAYVAFDKTDEIPNQNKYPIRALQEAVVNAIVHRDYEMPQPTKITVFEDRIEILSPGRLPYTIDQEKFVQGKAHPHWRNQRLAYFFNKLQLAQAEGQGIPTILRLMKEEGCPSPIFHIEEERVICVLPAHPRHKAIKELHAIEQLVVLGNNDEAFQRLIQLVKTDNYNYRALDLLANVSLILKRERDLYSLFSEIDMQFDRLPPNTILSIAESFSISKDQQITGFSLKLIELAMQSRLEEKQILKAVLNLKKLNQDEEIVKYLDEIFTRQAASAQNSSLLEERGRAHLALAKKCISSAQNPDLHRTMKAKAWEESRRYLNLAENDLNQALNLSSSPIEKDYIKKDIRYMKSLMNQARKPGFSRNR